MADSSLALSREHATEAAAPLLFNAPYAPPDETVAAQLLKGATRAPAAERWIDAYATSLIEGIRDRTGGLGGIEDFLHAYSLSTKEGLALMVLAEALLRVPDAATADRLIEDKLARGHWSAHDVKSDAFLVSASAWTLGVTARIIHPGETPETTGASGAARGDAPGDAAPGLPFRPGTDHRRSARSRRVARGAALFL
jgi:RHH-type proline utilization regulon transcriptional repressor/proline dehydrogenase/delta 1-pyrroline-5-carboxylate dehydrogenase